MEGGPELTRWGDGGSVEFDLVLRNNSVDYKLGNLAVRAVQQVSSSKKGGQLFCLDILAVRAVHLVSSSKKGGQLLCLGFLRYKAGHPLSSLKNHGQLLCLGILLQSELFM